MRIIEMMEKQQNSLSCDFYYEVARHFEKNAQFAYAIKILEKGKKEAILNPSFILTFEQKIFTLTNDKTYGEESR